MPDYYETRCTGLTLIPECRCRLAQLTDGKNADAKLALFPASRHLLLNFKHHLASIPCPSSSLDVQDVSLYLLAVWTMNMQGVSLSTTCSMDTQGVSFSIVSRMEVLSGSHFTDLRILNAGLLGIPSAWYRNEKNVNVGTSPVPE
jgi:hypothetical protein